LKHYYLDSAAHVPMSIAAQRAYIDFQNSEISPGHASSLNLIGRKVSGLIEKARVEISELLGAEKSSQIIFTNTCTEACNWAVEIIFNKAKSDIVYYSPFEHSAIKYLTETKNNIKKLNIINGKVNEFNNKYNICMHVQNEVGLIQPIEKFTGYLFSDMSQSLGKIKINLKESNVNLACFSGHKIGAGSIGILYIKDNKDWVTYGMGSRYYQDRVGSPDAAGIIGLAAGLRDNLSKMDDKVIQMKEFRESLEKRLKSYGLNVIYVEEDRIANISMIHLPKVAHLVLDELSEKFNIHCSLGAACSSKLTTTNPTMSVLGFEGSVNDFLRISSNGDYGKKDGEYVAETIINITKNYKVKYGT